MAARKTTKKATSKKATKKPARDIAQEMTDRIIEKLEQGTVPWLKPFCQMSNGALVAPRNLISNKPYRGINAVITSMSGYASPYWVTYKQALKAAGCKCETKRVGSKWVRRDANGDRCAHVGVRKGETGTRIAFYKFGKKEEKQKDGSTKDVRWSMLRDYVVFNVEQCDGIDHKRLRELREEQDAEPDVDTFEPIAACEDIVKGYKRRPAIRHGGMSAHYNPKRDLVQLPKESEFVSSEHYYATLFHELTHSTGHADRLNREGITDPIQFGSHKYSKEELCAEMGAAFLCALAGIDIEPIVDNSAAYIASWLRKLRGDPKFILNAAGQAQRAFDRIRGVSFEDKESN